jgi:Glycosyl hydrolases family 16
MGEPDCRPHGMLIMGLLRPAVSLLVLLDVHRLRRIACIEVKTGRWAGVVTAFITMSDAKDEIDWEFTGMCTLWVALIAPQVHLR